ncbi:CHAD domain-containing protein [Terriglobus sp. RCC_193]|uniref:CHAD domain-containing protein n=1 Tax=Terriglobus sp. RCC_193 TaxID=3239218 RepID=UPI003525FB71
MRLCQLTHLIVTMPVTTRTNTTRLQPVKALKEQVVALDAALLVAITSTEVGAVHRLRTTTRRVQAHLELLELLGHGDHPMRLPEHRSEAQAVMQRLRRIRRAAGEVRDLDVQTSMIALDAPQKAAVHSGSTGDAVRRQAKKLRKHLEAQREGEAKKLVAVLKDEEQDLAASLRELEQTIKPARRRALAPAALLEHAEEFFVARVKPVLRAQRPRKGEDEHTQLQRRLERLDEDTLHAIRKAAKLCRYMVEIAPEGTPVRAAAERFEAVQEAGGHWHDWLLLQQLSMNFHGRKAELTHRYEIHTNAALADYRLRLSELLPKLTA